MIFTQPEKKQHIEIQDINIVIQYFTIQIYRRLIELEERNRSVSTNSKENQQKQPQQNQYQSQTKTKQKQEQQLKLSQAVDKIIQTYTGYKPHQQSQIQCIKKMGQRILQIFGFYKLKCRNQSILNHVERQITSKINLLLNQNQINISKIMSFIIGISRRGFINKVSSTVPFYRSLATPSKRLSSYLKTSQAQKRNYKNTKKQVIKSDKPYIATVQFSQLSKGLITNMKRRKASSVIYHSNTVNNLSSSANNGETIDKLYSGLNLDKIHLTKLIQSCQHFSVLDQLKRNRSTLKKLQAAEMLNQKIISSPKGKVKTQASQGKQRMVLKEFGPNSNSKPYFQQNYDFLDHQQKELKKGPFMSSGAWNKDKRKIKTSYWKRSSLKSQNIHT